ncbi:hypothetical protein Q7Z55_01525 [Glaesserella parasuis]|uniref:hypothetical protein n=1 Tax=Glaesserella parasuis TaxID=738 RepID=UPI0003AC2CC0|nr:hypothetical protein [Glaesserella parasuis]EQA01642.1 hypothetical protein HPSNAG_1219 [Glaesserella parasuis str. Nagasaki]MDD2154928.1 hypothetical protein [Glaesserella parasuis]MDE3954728.1 hypothetical protein [Glaesserella parasuis]MDE3973759.1 hypothetical protein [Glaesserella parasuis]MDE4027542.1 hypothetical protein [Glaesserella parasuis]
MFSVSAQVNADNVALPDDLQSNANQAIQGISAKQAETQMALLKQESERLDKWAEDKIKAAQEAIVEVSEKIKQVKREKNQAANLEQLANFETQLKDLEKKRRQLRANIFDVEEEIEEERDRLFARIRDKLEQQRKVEHLFAVRWVIT